VKDRVVRLDDIFYVVPRFATTGDPGGNPLAPPPVTGYHTAYDRSFLGPDPWDLGPADGAIDLNEVFWLVAQYAHSCAY
jgi:hypothetical protein